eukprot:GILI01027848.1.p1 GENE.GILI01027848.1~~GILI01027848.1.p1  ORF type:complete len:604 (+),score=68.27 GILI01027848.1:196-1812(+)
MFSIEEEPTNKSNVPDKKNAFGSPPQKQFLYSSPPPTCAATAVQKAKVNLKNHIEDSPVPPESTAGPIVNDVSEHDAKATQPIIELEPNADSQAIHVVSQPTKPKGNNSYRGINETPKSRVREVAFAPIVNQEPLDVSPVQASSPNCSMSPRYTMPTDGADTLSDSPPVRRSDGESSYERESVKPIMVQHMGGTSGRAKSMAPAGGLQDDVLTDMSKSNSPPKVLPPSSRAKSVAVGLCRSSLSPSSSRGSTVSPTAAQEQHDNCSDIRTPPKIDSPSEPDGYAEGVPLQVDESIRGRVLHAMWAATKPLRVLTALQLSWLLATVVVALLIVATAFSPTVAIMSKDEATFLVRDHILTVREMADRFHAPRDIEDPSYLRHIYLRVLNESIAAMDELQEQYQPDDDVGLLQMALAYHHTRYRAKLYARRSDASWWNRNLFYPASDAYKFGLLRHGVQHSWRQLSRGDLYALTVQRSWDTMACLVQAEGIPCPSMEYAKEGFDAKFGVYPVEGFVEDMRLLLMWVSHPDRVTKYHIRRML